MTEKMVIKAVQKKSVRPLANLMGELGFTKISYLNDTLTIERVLGYDLKGKPELDYRVSFAPNEIVLEYEVTKGKNKRGRLLSVLPTFLNVLQIAEDYYDIKPSAIYSKRLANRRGLLRHQTIGDILRDKRGDR